MAMAAERRQDGEEEMMKWDIIREQEEERNDAIRLAYVYFHSRDGAQRLFTQHYDGSVYEYNGKLKKYMRKMDLNHELVIEVVATEASVIVLTDAGRILSYEMNESGVLGDGSREPREEMREIDNSYFSSRITHVAAGGWHVLALDAEGVLYGWGRNQWGQLQLSGSGSFHVHLPVVVVFPSMIMRDVVHMDAGGECSAAVTKDGRVLVGGALLGSSLSSIDVSVGEAITRVSCSCDGIHFLSVTHSVSCLSLWPPHVVKHTNMKPVSIHSGRWLSICITQDERVRVEGYGRIHRNDEIRRIEEPEQLDCGGCPSPCNNMNDVILNHGHPGENMEEPIVKERSEKEKQARREGAHQQERMHGAQRGNVGEGKSKKLARDKASDQEEIMSGTQRENTEKMVVKEKPYERNSPQEEERLHRAQRGTMEEEVGEQGSLRKEQEEKGSRSLEEMLKVVKENQESLEELFNRLETGVRTEAEEVKERIWERSEREEEREEEMSKERRNMQRKMEQREEEMMKERRNLHLEIEEREEEMRKQRKSMQREMEEMRKERRSMQQKMEELREMEDALHNQRGKMQRESERKMEELREMEVTLLQERRRMETEFERRSVEINEAREALQVERRRMREAWEEERNTMEATLQQERKKMQRDIDEKIEQGERERRENDKNMKSEMERLMKEIEKLKQKK